MRKHLLLLLLAVGFTKSGLAQSIIPQNGVHDERPNFYAFTNATIVVDPQTTLQNATLIVRNGRIEAIGTSVTVPAGAVVANLAGRRIYPGLIDLDSDYGMPEIVRGAPGQGRGFGGAPQLESNKKGAYYWNQAIQPENDASQLFKVTAAKADELRKLGFGAVLTHNHDGIARGNGALVTVADDRENMVLLRNGLSQHFSFSKGTSGQSNPNSIMGTVALLRQSLYDADWFKRSKQKPQMNLSLDAYNRMAGVPAFFEVGDKLGVLRADNIGDEFRMQFIIRTGGDEYQRIDEIKATGATLIVPVAFPQAYDVEDAWDADNVSLAEMKHWEMAPANAAMLAAANIPFVLTSSGLRNRSEFMANVRKAIEYGLSEQKALEALTIGPAKLIKADDLLGTLAVGKVANFVITSGNLFSPTNVVYENWIQGKQYVVTNPNIADIRGTYDLKIGTAGSPDRPNVKLLVTGDNPEKPTYQVTVNDTTKLTPIVSLDNNLISMRVALNRRQPNAMTRLTGYRDGTGFKGDGEQPNGQDVTWSATLSKPFSASIAKADTARKPQLGGMLYPFVGMGNTRKPQAQTMLIRNATVWTNEADGIQSNMDVLVTDGKIAKIGKNLPAPASGSVVDGTGKHLTNGIIDEHSHIALVSINEGSQSSTAEVRMSDAINPDDINIYRQLAGGVTSSQLLHGSANAIGGQSAIVKLKWGEPASNMLIKGADGFIKFALGENVKQSSAPAAAQVRFPQTRMGVEQVYMDHFMRAKEYAKAWADYNAQVATPAKGKKGAATATLEMPRRDIELDALSEILAKKRFITCHSYVQSEINMLLKVADSLGFKVNTFTHILEGYKVADKMAKHGVGGSSFADWWAYKMEVKDAIPYNAALMSREGVTVSINSDDAEMARRLNQEAAKTVLYGGMTEEQAWKMVTLNPAKLLHLDSRMGSIKAGKDADLVLWNNNPLSIYARPEFTMIEGAIYYSRENDDKNRETMEADRARLIQKMMQAKSGGQSTVRPTMRRQRMWHCEDVEGVFAEGEEKN
ncbi:amidohydrolase family protein [Fibrella forsythiae]|uniref:Amidohydrolase family protein n=1 Tax=Fibrella forsythiae TaxID=2817061 RepID=A0ABS3JDS9_9BACT|nr:amidohydrolase family protein [Fibrella forsythiae]MBO0948154.1 amidohydrolase family protein [Fibrella forsythiae]